MGQPQWYVEVCREPGNADRRIDLSHFQLFKVSQATLLSLANSGVRFRGPMRILSLFVMVVLIVMVVLMTTSVLAASQTLPAPQAITDPKQIVSKPDARIAKNLTIEKLYMTRQVGGSTWSPDGKTVAFVSNMSGRNNLWLVP